MLHTDIAEGVAVVTVDQPGRSTNVLSLTLSRALEAEIARLAAMPSVSGIILTSGKGTFIVGADLVEVSDLLKAGAEGSATELAILGRQIRLMETCGKPIVAVLPGTALGGGLEVALGCHYRIVADTPKAAYGFPEVGLGLLPGAGGTQRLPRLIGLELALPMLTTGHPVDAAEAKRLGLVDEIVAPDNLLDAARLALQTGRVPGRQPWDLKGWVAPGLPINGIEAFGAFTMANAAAAAEAGPDQPARGAILSCVYEGLRLPMDRALEVESHYFRCLLGTEAVGGLIAARFFLRQRMAKRGLRKADPSDPVQAEIAARLTSSIRTEAERMLAEAVQANVIRNAALRRGLPVPVKAATVRSRSPVAPATLDQIAGRLLTAGAEALAADEDQDLADFAALELAGFPEWTGGPSRWREGGWMKEHYRMESGGFFEVRGHDGAPWRDLGPYCKPD